MSKIFALIQNSTVVNMVLASDQDLKDPNSLWIDVSNMQLQPSIGWSYDGKNFTAPIVISVPTIPEASVQADVMNTVNRNNLLQNIGSIIFNTDTKTLQYFNGQTWIG